MRKLMLLVLMATIMVGCDNRTEEQKYQDYLATKEKAAVKAAHEARWKGFSVIVVDSCEYIVKRETETIGYRGYGWGFLAHKGNCRFCTERRKKGK